MKNLSISFIFKMSGICAFLAYILYLAYTPQPDADDNPDQISSIHNKNYQKKQIKSHIKPSKKYQPSYNNRYLSNIERFLPPDPESATTENQKPALNINKFSDPNSKEYDSPFQIIAYDQDDLSPHAPLNMSTEEIDELLAGMNNSPQELEELLHELDTTLMGMENESVSMKSFLEVLEERAEILLDKVKYDRDPQNNKGSIIVEGQIYDAETDRPLSNCRIGVGSKISYSNRDGYFRITGLAEGRKTILVKKEGYVQELVSGIELNKNNPTTFKNIYLTPLENPNQPQSALVGIGVSLSRTPKGLLVNSVVDEGPAYLVGINSGDYIIAVGGKSVIDLPPDIPVENIRGEEFSQVELTVLSDGETKNLTLTRERVQYTQK